VLVCAGGGLADALGCALGFDRCDRRDDEERRLFDGDGCAVALGDDAGPDRATCRADAAAAAAAAAAPAAFDGLRAWPAASA
jgi:hypothetical protein